MATAAALAFVQKLYVAYYQRPADYAGQQFWAEKLGQEGGASAIATAFATSTESVALYGSQDVAAQINAVYLASFGREAETSGLQFYLKQISQGLLTIGTMAVSVLNGAQGTDLTTLNSKLAVADAYTTAASDAAGILKYVGTTAADTARTFLSAVTTANQAAQTAAVTINLNSIVAAGNSFTLTTGIDNFVGGASNDSFSSTLAGAFGLLDSLDGGAGTDILNVSDTTAIATASSQVVKNIETVSLNSSAGVTADMSTWTGLTKATLSGVGTMSATAADSVAASITTSGGNAVTVIGTGGDLAVTTGNTAGATVNIGQTAVANKFTSVSVTGGQAVNITDRSGAAAVTGSTLKTVSVNGAALATTITGDGVTTLNLTNLTGAAGGNGVTLNAVAGTRALVLNLNGVDTAADGAATTAETNTIKDVTATSLSINAVTAKSFDVTVVADAATSVAVKADVGLHLDGLTAALATKLDVSGAGKLEVTADTLAAAAVITSTNTGGVTLTQALLAGQQFVGTASAGADVITLTTGTTLAYTTGAGNDVVTAEQFGIGGSVDAGAGTGDILRMAQADILANTVTTATKAASFTGFETLVATDLVNANIDVTKFVGVTAVNLLGGLDTATLTVNTANTVTLGTDAANAIGVTVGGTGIADTLSLNMNGWNSADAATFTGIETLNINSGSVVTGGTAVVATTTAAAITNTAATFATTLTMNPSAGGGSGVINVTGAADMTFTGVVTASHINASALTGILTISGTAANAITITGGTKADVITGSAAADLISGGDGADTITGGLGLDTLTGGAGADTFSFNAAAAETNNPVIGNFDTITDFVVGTDKLQFTTVTDIVSGQQTAVQTAVTALAANSTAVEIVTAMALANTTDLGVSFATYAGDTYVLYETTGANATFTVADDVFIKLTGVTTIPTFAVDVVA